MPYELSQSAHPSSPGFKHFLKTRPVYLFLLPAFFVLHGFNRNYNSVPAGSAVLLILFYTGGAIIAAVLAWFIYRDLTKASLMSFFIMTWLFFFGSVQDGLKELSPHTFISKYRFLLPLGCLLFLVLAYRLKKRKKSLLTLTSYLNILLLVLVLIETGGTIIKISGSPKNMTLNPGTFSHTGCDSCKKPDIYFILLDEYAGNTALKDVFHFNNDPFENDLRQRGFHVVKNSISNYNLTPFSMASALNMDYLTSEAGYKNNLNVGYTYQLIRSSTVIELLKTYGYQFYNNSVFDFPGQPAKTYSLFFPYGSALITRQTFFSKLASDIRLDILQGRLKFPAIQKKIAYEYLHFNDDIFTQTCQVAAGQTQKPKFVYAHFMMPHYPYYFNSKGQPAPFQKLTSRKSANSTDYIEYLQYANGRILQLVDSILLASPSPPVIMLLSDHGFRRPEEERARRYDFMNLNAIYLPDKNYRLFKDSLSNVNHFRVFFNAYFNQHFPLLKDSTISLY